MAEIEVGGKTYEVTIKLPQFRRLRQAVQNLEDGEMVSDELLKVIKEIVPAINTDELEIDEYLILLKRFGELIRAKQEAAAEAVKKGAEK